MAENVMDNIVAELKKSATTYYPEHGELKNVRIVGHTPKADHFIYDVVMDFDKASERVAAKVYRPSKNGHQGAASLARAEQVNITSLHKVFDHKKLEGVPRPIGDFSSFGAVVTEKIGGMPLQSIVMKGALLPGYADNGALGKAAAMSGLWLRNLHKATAEMPEPFEPATLTAEIEKLCVSCKGEGLDDNAIRVIMSGVKKQLSANRKTLPSSAVLNDFTPLNVLVSENGISVCDFSKLKMRGSSLNDAAQFLASIEALEKYPFCNRAITTQVQQNFTEAYGASVSDQAMVRVLKMKYLLSMFAQGRGKESAMRKKVMWATVMKRFIQQAAQRSLAPAA